MFDKEKNLAGTKYRANSYQLYENACQLIADAQAQLSALELGQKLYNGLGVMAVQLSFF